MAATPGFTFAEPDHVPQFAGRGIGAVTIGLVHHEDVTDLKNARLGGLGSITHPRRQQDDNRVGDAHNLDL